MNILAFNTSTEKFSISIVKNNKIVFKLSKLLKKTYSKYLILIIKKSLKRSNLDIKKINYILISLGPGSFTGVRIGVVAAKGIGLPHKIKVLGLNNMDVIANSIKQKTIKKKIITKIKSKKNDYYYQVFNSGKKSIKKISYFTIFDLPKIFANKNIIFCGDIDMNLINEIKKSNKMAVFDKKLNFNADRMIDIFKKKGINSLEKDLDPIYVYDHYAKK